MHPLAYCARVAARASRPLGYHGIGRLLKPLSRLPNLRAIAGNVRLPSGASVSCPAFDYCWAGHLWTGKSYEPEVEKLFNSLARFERKALVDCSASIGYWSARACDFGFVAVAAVEPDPEFLPWLHQNIARSGVFNRIHNLAIADCSGKSVRLGGTSDHAAAH